MFAATTKTEEDFQDATACPVELHDHSFIAFLSQELSGQRETPPREAVASSRLYREWDCGRQHESPPGKPVVSSIFVGG
jgi:hypothetical protein